ncbi:MAG: hypothetical protein M5R41_06530 [Bacteroidia bacterium]|nr:hypothetical protein [Bacteroidia bacterium]
MKRIIFFLLCFSSLLAACSQEPGVEGKWKNGDGNLIRFDNAGKAWLGQEGYPDEGECNYTVTADTVVVTTLPEGGDSLYNSYRMVLSDDTLRIVVFGLHATGMQQLIPIEEFALRSGKPMDKLTFIRLKEEK